MKVVGILGGGPRAAHLAEAVFHLGAGVACFDPDFRAPLRSRTPLGFCSSWDDSDALGRFADSCAVITCEHPAAASEAARRAAERAGVEIVPDPRLIDRCEDRVALMEWLAHCEAPVVPFVAVSSPGELRACLASLQYPVVLRRQRLGRRSFLRFATRGELELWLDGLPTTLHDNYFPSVMETSIATFARLHFTIARDAEGRCLEFPPCEMVTGNEGEELFFCPSRLEAAHLEPMRAISRRLAETCAVVGVLTVEWRVGVPEARRSSGDVFVFVTDVFAHLQGSAQLLKRLCRTGPADALARALLRVPLGDSAPVTSLTLCSAPILGETVFAQGGTGELDLSPWRDFPDVLEVVRYGMVPSRRNEEIGRFAVQAQDAEAALALAQRFGQALSATARS